MHCPRCGQQQVSQETRFCARCGLPLEVIAGVLANNGENPHRSVLPASAGSLFTRKNGLIFTGFWFLVMLFIVTPILAILDADVLVPIAGVLSIFGSLLFLFISLILLPKSSNRKATSLPSQGKIDRHSTLYAHPDYRELPAGEPVGIADFVPPSARMWRAPETGDLARPASVTENTTKLLQKDLEK